MRQQIEVLNIEGEFIAYNGLLNHYVSNLKEFEGCQDNICNKLTILQLKEKIEFYNDKVNNVMKRLKR